MSWKPMATFSLFARIFNAILTFFMSLAIALAQRVFLFFLSRAYASATEQGSSMPDLCVFFKNHALRFLTSTIMCLRFRNMAFTHQLNPCSLSMPCATAYSAIARGYASFKFLKGCQEVGPSFHWMHRCHPVAEQPNEMHPLCTMRWSSFDTARALDLWLAKVSMSRYSLPSLLHDAYIDSAMTSVICSLMLPPSNSTWYTCESKMGLLLARPMASPRASRLQPMTAPCANKLQRGNH
jgi:hypothetical protein